jgi:hypothetical protein
LSTGDVGDTIVVQETASNLTGPGSPINSISTAVVLQDLPVSTSSPSISGALVQSATLSESHASWTNGPLSYTYQWEQCATSGGGCEPIAGATSQQYALGASDVGHSIEVLETATNSTGAGNSADSATTAAVVGAVPVSTSSPSIAGVAVERATLTESHGSWTNSPTSYGYQWEACDGSGSDCVPIAGATGQAYALGGSDVGHSIEVVETAANATGAGNPANSAATAPVSRADPANVPVSTSPPSISGAAVEGTTLTEVHGSWTNSPTLYGYQWEDCDGSGGGCVPIASATSQAYALRASDFGHAIEVLETAGNSTGAGSPANSEATAVVAQLAPAYPQALAASAASVSTKGTSAIVQVACAAATDQRCAGAVVVSAWERKQGSGVVSVVPEHGALKPGLVAVVVARAPFAVAAEHKEALHISLNPVGKRLLASFYTLPTVLAIQGTSAPLRQLTFAYARIQSRVTYFYTYTEYSRYYTSSSTSISKLVVDRLPAGAQVAISCDGGGCPFRLRVLEPRKQELVLLDPLAKSSLTPGASLKIVVTAPDSIGKVVIVSIQGGARPTQAERCLPPGDENPVACAMPEAAR